MCICVCLQSERYLRSPFLANPTIYLPGKNSVTWLEIILGNAILCTSWKRYPYQTTSVLIKFGVKKKKKRWGILKRWDYREKILLNIFRWKTFLEFLLTIQITFILMQRNSESGVLPKHKVLLLSPGCPQPPTVLSSSSCEHVLQCKSQEQGSEIPLIE